MSLKILIIRLSSIGDIVLTTPVMRNIKNQYPQAVIHYLTKKPFIPLLEANPFVDVLHTYEDSQKQAWENLQKIHFDFVFDLHHNLRTFFIKSNLHCQKASFPKLNIAKWIYTTFKINILPKTHIVNRYSSPVENLLEIVNDEAGLDYFFPSKTKPLELLLPETFIHKPYLAVSLGAALPTKQMPASLLLKVLTQCNMPIVLLGGKEDIAKADSLKIALPHLYHAVGQLSIHESACIIKHAKTLLTADTGLMHIGAALKVPMVVVWGNTVPEFGMGPYYGKRKVPYFNIEVANLSCRPCSKIGFKSCPKKHFKCMEDQNPQQIFTSISELFTADFHFSHN